MERFEAFWFTVKTVGRIIDDLFHVAVKLETLKEIDNKTPTGFAAVNDVAVYTAALYDGLYRLIEILAKLQWVKKVNIKKRFRQLHFAWLLRNNFLVHPKARSPLAFENIGRSASFPRDKRILPYTVFGPEDLGWTFYFQFQAAKAGIDLELVEFEEAQRENKERFIDVGGWDAVGQDEQLLARIKAVGLAPVDQEALAGDMRQLFRDFIFPQLTTRISVAESDKVFLR